MSKSNNDFSKKTKGRQRIEMKKMKSDRNLQVTFSKRRTGVFKKVSELRTLCGVDLPLIIFSFAYRVFSFGSPNMKTLINHFLNRAPPLPPPAMIQSIHDAHYTANVRDLKAHLTLINNEIEAEKNRGKELDLLMQAAHAQFWWACPLGDMNRAQLIWMKTKLEALKELVTRHTEKLLTLSATAIANSTNNNNNLNQFYAGCPFSNVNNTIICQPLLIQDPMSKNHVLNGIVKLEPNFDNDGGYGPDDRFY